MAAVHPKLAPLLGRLRELIPPMLEGIGDERLRWLKALPPVHWGEGFAVVHASPKDLWRAPMANAANEEIQKTYSDLAVPVVVYGHIHVSHVRQLREMTVANAGSVSQSYDADRRAAYALVEGKNVTIRRVQYDVEIEAKELRHAGLPHADWLSRILRQESIARRSNFGGAMTTSTAKGLLRDVRQGSDVSESLAIGSPYSWLIKQTPSAFGPKCIRGRDGDR
jgi:hypothetical protein